MLHGNVQRQLSNCLNLVDLCHNFQPLMPVFCFQDCIKIFLNRQCIKWCSIGKENTLTQRKGVNLAIR